MNQGARWAFVQFDELKRKLENVSDEAVATLVLASAVRRLTDGMKGEMGDSFMNIKIVESEPKPSKS